MGVNIVYVRVGNTIFLRLGESFFTIVLFNPAILPLMRRLGLAADALTLLQLLGIVGVVVVIFKSLKAATVQAINTRRFHCVSFTRFCTEGQE